MNKKTIIIILVAVLVVAALAVGGYWWYQSVNNDIFQKAIKQAPSISNPVNSIENAR